MRVQRNKTQGSIRLTLEMVTLMPARVQRVALQVKCVSLWRPGLPVQLKTLPLPGGKWTPTRERLRRKVRHRQRG